MTGGQTTAAAIISFSERLEEGAADYYRALAQRFPAHESAFLSFAQESDRNRVLVTRTYRETVSDALETGFAFEGLDLAEYVVEASLAEDTALSEALARAMELENRAIAFYQEVAELSRSLLATIPSAFRRVARRRDGRRQALETLLQEA